MKRRWRVFGWLGAWWAILMGSLGGCFVSRSGERSAMRPDGSGVVWPERDVDVVRPYAEATPDVIYRLSLAEGADASALDEADREKLDDPAFTILSRRLTAKGLLRVYERPAGAEHEDEIVRQFLRFIEGVLFGFTPNAAFLTSREFGDGERVVELEAPRVDEGKEVIEGDVVVDSVRLRAGVEIRIPPKPEGPVRGVMLHFTALFGNEYESKLLASLREAGWVIFDISTQVNIEAPPVEAHLAAAAAMQSRLDAMGDAPPRRVTLSDLVTWDRRSPRLTVDDERRELSFAIRLNKLGSFQACPGADLSAIGVEIARQVDEVLAENAYAAEAVVEYIDAERPELAGKPLVVIGFSAGALATPAACARLGDRVDAAILIGGAADLFAVSQEGTLTNGGVRIRCGHNFVAPKTIEAIHRAYLEHVRLDPLKTAPLLAATPTLVIRSDSDEWVPARYGRLLVEKLGRPDVQTLYGGGHMILFWRLPGRAPSILRWLDRVVPPVAGGAEAAARDSAGAADAAASRAEAGTAR